MNDGGKATIRLVLLSMLLVAMVLPVDTLTSAALAAPGAVILDAKFDAGTDDFAYQDDAFGTSQPGYAAGSHVPSGGYGGSGGLQVILGGINSNTVNDMSGGWVRTFNLGGQAEGAVLSFRYQLSQSSSYEWDEYSRTLASLDGALLGQGAKTYVDHVGGTNTSLSMTTRWQQYEIYLGSLSPGDHTLILGGFNNRKNQSDEQTEVLIDEVLITSDNPAPATSGPQSIVGRLDINQFKSYIQTLSGYGDRCQMTGCTLTSFDNAQAWLEGELQAMGYTVERHYYTYDGTQRSNLYVTKTGAVHADQMYMVSAHLDGRGGGGAADDDGSGSALVLEAARVFAASDVESDISIRFLWWGNEESGLNGSTAYRADRFGAAGEPTWLGHIAHDMVLYDHGVGSPSPAQSPYADLDVEYRGGTTYQAQSQDLAYAWRLSNRDYSPDYPANVGNYSTNTDDTPFHNYCPSVSVRENRRRSTYGEWINPYYHTANDLYANYSEDDFRLGFNAVQATVGVVAELAGARLVGPNLPPMAYPQSVTTPEDTPVGITLTGSDPDNNPLTFHIDTNPSHGALSGTAPNLTYSPDANYHGADAFTFHVGDGSVPSAPATVDITVTPVDDPPVAFSRSASTPAGSPVSIRLSGSDPDGGPVSYELLSDPGQGSLSGDVPSLTYVPGASYSGPDSFDFRVTGGGADSTPATVSITVYPATELYFDDFETDQGWVVDPDGTDSAGPGAWERAVPQATELDGPKQLAIPVSGRYDLVTAALAGTDAGKYDLDRGVTSIRSPDITLPTGQDLGLSLYYYLAHSQNASPADYMRVRVVGSTTTVFDLPGASRNVDAAWAGFNAPLNDFAGETIYLLVEAADEQRASLVEAAVDDVRIAVSDPSTPLLAEDFDAGSGGFAYEDDVFRFTNRPGYADGEQVASGGRTGGALQVTLGGKDQAIIDGMSGGWQRSFNLAAPSELTLSLWYKLTQSAYYEADELSEVLVSLDGALYGLTPTEYVAQMAGNGNGGGPESTGWQHFAASLGTWPAGEHRLVLGGYNGRKSYHDETTEVLIDDLLLVGK